MPTYQYACTDCTHAFDQVQTFSEDALSVCPACTGRLRKVYNAVGVVFKGSGFYRNDSRATTSSTSPAASASDSGSGSSSASTSDGGSSSTTTTTTKPTSDTGAKGAKGSSGPASGSSS